MDSLQIQTLKEQFIELTFSKDWKQRLCQGAYTDNELIRYCLDKSWPDAIIYVRKKNTPNDITIVEHAKEIKDILFDCIIRHTWNNDFDAWHDELCQKTDFGMRYGVWQKFINIVFKYIFCINDKLENPISVDLNQCHLPLDDNTLLWCRNKGFTTITSWNYISQEEYITIRENIQKFLESNEEIKSAVLIDFLVWRMKKICDVLKGIKNLRDDFQGLSGFEDWFATCGFNLNDPKELLTVLDQIDKFKSYANLINKV